MSEAVDNVKRALDAHKFMHPEHYDADGKHLDTCAAVATNAQIGKASVYAPKPKSNVRTREQDEFMTPEKKARESKRQCRARVSLPSRDGKTLVSFECTETLHASKSDGYLHSETGRVRLRNNRIYEYTIYWNEATSEEVWRIEGAATSTKEGGAE